MALQVSFRLIFRIGKNSSWVTLRDPFVTTNFNSSLSLVSYWYWTLYYLISFSIIGIVSVRDHKYRWLMITFEKRPGSSDLKKKWPIRYTLKNTDVEHYSHCQRMPHLRMIFNNCLWKKNEVVWMTTASMHIANCNMRIRNETAKM